MLGIWHRGEWTKRDLVHLFYGRVKHGSPFLGLDFASLISGYLSLYFNECYTFYMWYI